MPICLFRPRGAAIVVVFAAALSTLAFAGLARASVPVDLTVVDSNGEVLADYLQYTDKTRIKTDPKADCLGAAGSGDRVKVAGPTALSAVVDGADFGDRDLRPVSLTDDTGFGLGVCGIGGKQAPSTGFWYLTHDRAGSQTGGDSTKVRKRDQVTWYRDPDFSDAPPVELELIVPNRTQRGIATEVQVFEHDDAGRRSPAAGVTVTGASDPTDAEGKTTVTPSGGDQTLTATREGAISDSAELCAAADAKDCPKDPPMLIGGSRDDDRVKDGRGGDRIKMGPGKDKVNTRDGSVDRISCGGGKDKVKADREDKVAKSCEKVLV